MALVLNLKYAENLRGKAERLAKVSFRGVFHYTETIESDEGSVLFNQTFQWPVARPIEKEEVIEIQLFNYNKYLSNRLIGTFRMFLQELVEVGNVRICDSLLDSNNVVMKTTVTFELTYNAPDGSVGSWHKGGFDRLSSDELRQGISEEERNNLLNVERFSQDSDSIISSPAKSSHGSKLSLASKTSGGRSPRHSRTLQSVVKKMVAVSKVGMVGGGGSDIDDKRSLMDDIETDPSLDAKAAEIASMMGGGKDSNLEEDRNSESAGTTLTVPGLRRTKEKIPQIETSSMKAQDFQVCITVIEARQLAGLNMDPVVCVQVGDQKKIH